MRKEFPLLFAAKAGRFTVVDVPPMTYFMIDGQGDPNTSQAFQDAVETLYAVSFGLKMPFKKTHPDLDYVVPPLQGQWHAEDMARFSMDAKKDWLWTLMIAIPGFVPVAEARAAIDAVARKRHPPAIERVRVDSLHEGTCVQTMHLGPYDAEPPLIARMHEWIAQEGCALAGKHHEIYLSDARRVAPEKLRTILRQPVTRSGPA